MPEHFPPDTLRRLVRDLLDEPGELSFRPVSTGKHNASFWVDGAAGRCVLRIAPPDDAGFLFYERRMMRQEPDLHALVRSRTGIPVAAIAGYDFSRTKIDRDYLLMHALPGVPLSQARFHSPDVLETALEETGRALRQLHALTAGDCLGEVAYGYLGAHHPMPPQPSWAEAFQVMWNRLLDDLVACGSYSPEEAGYLRGLFEQHAEHFDRPVQPCLLHMDVWAQNILIDSSGHLSGLVDFDRALWGDPEIEFAVLDYCGISEPAFWRGYGQRRDTSPSAQVRRLFYLLYELQKYMPIRVWRRSAPAGAQAYKRQAFQLVNELI